jgi:hypothetical protein
LLYFPFSSIDGMKVKERELGDIIND